MRISSYLRLVILEMGFTEEYVQEKSEEVLAIVEKKGLTFDPRTPILAGYDMNGPLTSTWDASLHPLIIVQKGILALHGDNVRKVMISGWDLTTLRDFRERRLGLKPPDIGLIGELGMVWEYGDRIVEVSPIAGDEHLKMKRAIFLESAKAGLKIAIQGNIASRCADIYFEADGASRGNLREHFLVKNREVSTADIFQALKNKSGFNYIDGKIEFTPTLETVKEIDFVLGRVFTLQSVRLVFSDGKIILRRDPEDKENFTLKDMENFVKTILPAGWESDPNNDFCVDLVFHGDGVKINKETTANKMAKRLFRSKPFVITNVGDKKADVFTGPNTIFFPQYGCPAWKYCRENNIPCVPVMHAGDYSLILAALIGVD